MHLHATYKYVEQTTKFTHPLKTTWKGNFEGQCRPMNMDKCLRVWTNDILNRFASYREAMKNWRMIQHVEKSKAKNTIDLIEKLELQWCNWVYSLQSQIVCFFIPRQDRYGCELFYKMNMKCLMPQGEQSMRMLLVI